MSKYSSIANSAALALSVSKNRLDHQHVAAALTSASVCS
jgi:hypothetical protein